MKLRLATAAKMSHDEFERRFAPVVGLSVRGRLDHCPSDIGTPRPPKPWPDLVSIAGDTYVETLQSLVSLIAFMAVDDTQERLAISEPADVFDPEDCHFVSYAVGKRRNMRRDNRVGQVPKRTVL